VIALGNGLLPQALDKGANDKVRAMGKVLALLGGGAGGVASVADSVKGDDGAWSMDDTGRALPAFFGGTFAAATGLGMRDKALSKKKPQGMFETTAKPLAAAGAIGTTLPLAKAIGMDFGDSQRAQAELARKQVADVPVEAPIPDEGSGLGLRDAIYGGTALAALGGLGYVGHRLLKKWDAQKKEKGRIKVTLPTRQEGDQETTVELPIEDIAFSKKMYEDLGRDVRRRIRAENNSRIRRRKPVAA